MLWMICLWSLPDGWKSVIDSKLGLYDLTTIWKALSRAYNSAKAQQSPYDHI